MDTIGFDRLARMLAAPTARRGLGRLLLTLPLAAPLAALLARESAAARRHKTQQRRSHRRAPIHEQRKKKKTKKCARAGQLTSKKRKKCCQGLAKGASGRCAACTPATCDGTVCGSVPDGCGGTLSCACPANQICLSSGVCQPCTVTCTGASAQCGAALQTAMNGGGTVYVCPGRYQGGFILNPPLASLSVIGAGEGSDAASNTILDANDLGQVLVITAGVGLVALERLRVTDGNTGAEPGAGILHQGSTLRLTECTISGNTAANGFGGGIYTTGTLQMTRCTVRDNHATGTSGAGGGIFTAGTTTLTDCLVEDNRAENQGGGLWIGGGTTTLAGTTQAHDNVAGIGGGTLIQAGTLDIAETCRVTENTASTAGQGGGIHNDAGLAAVTLQGADPSPIVVNNCHRNCVGVAKCAGGPVSC